MLDADGDEDDHGWPRPRRRGQKRTPQKEKIFGTGLTCNSFVFHFFLVADTSITDAVGRFTSLWIDTHCYCSWQWQLCCQGWPLQVVGSWNLSMLLAKMDLSGSIDITTMKRCNASTTPKRSSTMDQRTLLGWVESSRFLLALLSYCSKLSTFVVVGSAAVALSNQCCYLLQPSCKV